LKWLLKDVGSPISKRRNRRTFQQKEIKKKNIKLKKEERYKKK